MTFAGQAAVNWPTKAVDAVLDYSYDATADLGADTLVSLALSIAPSGLGELTAAKLSFAGAVITAWLSGGVAGRCYVVQIDGTCTSGRVFSWLIGLAVDPLLEVYPPVPPPAPGFGTPLTSPS